jgi:predicted DNA-binding protein (MmcQ/YjbR family)
MNIEMLRNYCIAKKAVKETFPFGEDTLVFKVLDKMFALASLSNPDSVNLKCDPEKAIELRERYECVQPGYHMNKKHWNTVYFGGSVNDKLICEWIDHSYNMVVKGMNKKEQALLK